jgi:hypothetical protein
MIKSKRPWTTHWPTNKLKGSQGPLILSIVPIEKYHKKSIEIA